MILHCTCGKQWFLKDELATPGRRIRCKSCGGTIMVPTGDTKSKPAPPPPEDKPDAGPSPEELHKRVADLQAKLVEAEPHKERAESLERAVKEREGMLQAFESDARAKQADLQMKLNALREEKDHLQTQLIQTKAVGAEAGKKVRDLETSVKRLEDKSRDSERTSKELEDLRATLSEAEQKRLTAENELESARGQVCALEADKDKEVGEKNRVIAELEQQLNESKAAVDRVAELEKQLKGTEKSQKRIAELERELEEANEAKTRLVEMEFSLAEAKGAQDRVAELEKSLKEARKAGGKVDELKDQIEELEGTKKRVAQLEKDLEAAKAGSADAQKLRDRVAELEKVLESGASDEEATGQLRSRITELEKDLETAKTGSTDAQKLQDRVAELERQLEEERAAREKAEKEKPGADPAATQELQKKIETLEKDLEKAGFEKEILDAKNEEISLLQKENMQLLRDLEDAKSRAPDASDAPDTAPKSEENVTQLLNRIAQLESDLEGAQMRLVKTRTRHRRVDEAKQLGEQAKYLASDLMRSLEGVSSQIAALQDRAKRILEPLEGFIRKAEEMETDEPKRHTTRKFRSQTQTEKEPAEGTPPPDEAPEPEAPASGLSTVLDSIPDDPIRPAPEAPTERAPAVAPEPEVMEEVQPDPVTLEDGAPDDPLERPRDLASPADEAVTARIDTSRTPDSEDAEGAPGSPEEAPTVIRRLDEVEPEGAAEDTPVPAAVGDEGESPAGEDNEDEPPKKKGFFGRLFGKK